jgi:fatty-acyl-CoA synthase
MKKAIYPATTDKQLRDWTVTQLLDDAATRAGNRIAVRAGASSWTYLELKADSERLACFLLTLFKAGERVAIWGSNSAPWLLYQLAAARAGLVLVTLNPALRALEVESLLRQSQSVGVIIDSEYRGTDLAGTVATIRPSLPTLRTVLRTADWREHLAAAPGGDIDTVCKPHDIALILYTSGTTGAPKGVQLSHRGIVNNALLGSELYELADGLPWLSVMPYFHIGGSVTTNLGCIARLGTNVIFGAFEPGAMLRLIERERIAWFPCVPTMAIALMEHPEFAATDLSSVEVIQTGGTVVTPEFIRVLAESFKADVQVMFGQTEAGGVMCKSRRGDPIEVIAETVGRPYPHTELRICDTATGEPVDTNVVGEIRIRSPYMTRGYFNNPDATAAAFDAEGFLRTGDLGTLDDDGNVRVTGRLKEMIIRGGENIYPREIEDHLGEFPGIAECAVVGVPNERWGEEVAVAIRCRAGTTIDPDAAREFLLGRIARHKVPKMWKLVDDFPRTASGKIQKFELVRLFKEPSAA